MSRCCLGDWALDGIARRGLLVSSDRNSSAPSDEALWSGISWEDRGLERRLTCVHSVLLLRRIRAELLRRPGTESSWDSSYRCIQPPRRRMATDAQATGRRDRDQRRPDTGPSFTAITGRSHFLG